MNAHPTPTRNWFRDFWARREKIRLLRSSRLRVESLEDRVVPSADWAEPNNSQAAATYLGRSGTLNWSALSVDTPSDVDWLAFRLDTSPTRGQYVGINLAEGAGDLNVELYNSAGTKQGQSYGLGSTEQISLDRRNPGTYFLKVFGNAGATGGYTFFSNGPALSGGDFAEANDAPASAFVIPSIVGGFNVGGLSLHSPSDQDWYRIQLLATGDATSKVQVNFSNAAGNVDLELYRSDGTTRVGASTGADDSETIGLAGLGAGTYYARVFGAAGATNPAYSFTATGPAALVNDRFEPNNSTSIFRGGATALGSLSGPQTYADLSVNTATDLDYFSFAFPTAGRATARIDFANALGDLQLVLYAADRVTVLASSVGTTDAERIDFTAAANSTYCLKVFGQGGATGGYTLQVIPPVPLVADPLEPNNSPASPTDLGAVAGALTRAGLSVHTGGTSPDTDWFRFSLPWAGSGGHFARIDFSHAAGDLDLALYAADGTTRIATSSSASDGEQVSLAGLAAGTYYLNVYGYNGATNPAYSLTLNGPSGPAPDALEPNETASAATDLGVVVGTRTRTGLSVHDAADNDWFQFTTSWPGQVGNYARLGLSDAAGDLDLQLVGPDGTVLATASGPNAVEEVSLAGLAAGTYFLRAYGAGGAINPSYSLTVVGPAGPAPDARESNNTPTTASNLGRISGPDPITYSGLSIHSGLDVDWFRFETVAPGAAGHYARIEFQNRLGDLELALYGPDGTTLIASSAGTTDYEEVSLAGLAAGVFYFKVYGRRGIINPAYSLTVRAPAVPTLPPDRLESNDLVGSPTELRSDGKTTLSGTRDESGLTITPGDIDVFRFTTELVGSASNYVSLSFLNADGDLSLDLLAADGSVINTSASATADGESLSLAGLAAGTYYARVSGASATTANTYDLRVKAPDAPDAWTLMVYMTASDLEDEAFIDINEMEAAAALLPGSVNITVFWDQSAAGTTYPTGVGGQHPQPAWGTAGRAVIAGDTTPRQVRTTFEILPEQDSGDPATLQSFIRWSAQNAPAQRYALMLWDHGNGIYGFNFDNNDGVPRDSLTTPELVQAIAGGGVPIDVLGFDSCLMGMDELAYSLRQSAAVFVASEEAQDSAGNDYQTLLDVLRTQNPYQVDAEALAAGFVYSYGHRPRKGTNLTNTYSAVRSSGADDLAAALANFVTTVGSNPAPDLLQRLRQNQSAAIKYFRPDFRDLGSFMSNVFSSSRYSPAIRAAAAAVNTALAAAVVSKTADRRGSSGLAVYLPGAGGGVTPSYASTYAAFNQATHWDAFLQVLTAGWAPDPGDDGPDWSERNDTWSRAYPIGALGGPENRFPGLNLHLASDEDWFSVTILTRGDAASRLSVVPEDVNSQIEVELYPGTYVGTGNPVRGGNGSRTFSLLGLESGTYLVRVRTTGDNPVPGYELVIDAPGDRPEGTELGDPSSSDKAHQITPVGTELVNGPGIAAGAEQFFTVELPVAIGTPIYQIVLTTQIAASLSVAITGLPDGPTPVDTSNGEAVLRFVLPTNAPTVGLRVAGDPTLAAQYSLRLGVVPNTPPTISTVADLTIARDTATGPLAFTVSDAETAVGDLVVTFDSSNPGLIPNGSIVLGGSGASRTVTATPAAGQSGTATITLTVRDADGVAATESFAVRVNAPPTATPDLLSVAEDSLPTVVPVLGNDSFAPDAGETLVVASVGQPSHGAVTFVGGVVKYAPRADYNGSDSFTYVLSDGNGGMATGTVTVTVIPMNDPPTASPDFLSVNEDSPPTVVDVLANDSSAPDAGETLSVSSVGLASHGSVTFSGGVVKYAPATNYIGPDSFTYTITDGSGLTATATVNVLVGTLNDPPTANPDVLSVAEDSAATVVGVLGNDSFAPDVGETLSVASVTQPAHGVASLVGGVVKYAPAADYFGPDSFTYVLSDGNGGVATGTVTVTVIPVNDPPVTVPDAYRVPATGSATLAVLANDLFAPDAGETLTVTAVSQPATGGTAAVAPGGGGVVFTPAPGFVGTATFTYTASDGNGGTATAAVAVTVEASGLGPVRPVAVGGGADGSVRLVTAAGTTLTLSPFGNTGTPTRTAAADVDGDGVADVVAVTGPRTALRLAVLSGADGRVLLAPFDPFGGDFLGGGYAAAGDLDADGRAEFVVTPDEGGGPRVTVYSLTPDGTATRRANFFGIDDANFRGGARAALGDVNGDGVPDVVVAAGFGGGPRTAIFTGQSVLAGAPARLVNDFFAFPGADAVSLRNGSFVAAGDVTGDGYADLAFGGGPGGAPRVFILSGALVAAGQVAAAQAAPVANFFVAGDLSDRGGARVAVTNADGDAKADVAVGSGAGRPGRVRLYHGKDFAGGGEPPATDLDVLGGGVLADGVYVG